MQLKIYKRLNLFLSILLLITIGFIIGTFINNEYFGDSIFYIFAGIFIFSIIVFLVFKMIEVNIDKQIVQRHAIKGNVAIANIKSATPIRKVRDSSAKSYNLWKIDADLYDQDLKKHSVEIIEKFNLNVKSVPKGSVYVTYNPNKPNDGLIIQNVIISHIHTLMPIVSKYENSNIPIKYLSAYYNDGLVIETFKQTMKKEDE